MVFLTLLFQINLTFYDIPHANATYIQMFAHIVIEQMKSLIVGLDIQANV
jgi:hypothetical protein